MKARWSVGLDLDDDGRTDRAGEDLSAAVLGIRWRRGMARAYDCVARPGSAEITLRNTGGRFSPERNALPPGRLLQIRSNDGAQQRVHFSGQIRRVEPEPGSLGARRVVLHAEDAAAQLAGHHIRLPPLAGLRVDEVIGRCLDEVPLRRWRMRNVWLTGMARHSELGSNTRLATVNIRRALRRDPDVLALVGDTWSAGIPALAAIEEVCAAGRGRFYIDHEGRARYLSRRDLLGASEPRAVFRDDMQGLGYRWGEGRVSEVEVWLTPRSRGAPDTALWTLGEALAIEPGASGRRELLLRYRDAPGQPCGALTVSEPVAGLDWRANTHRDGRGQDLSGQVEFIVREAGLSAARVALRNRGRKRAWLQAGARLRGTPIRTGDPLLVRERSLASEALYGPASLRIELRAPGSLEQARTLARYELARRRMPRGLAQHMTLSGRAALARALGRRLFERIRIEEGQSGHGSDYFVIGEEREIEASGGERLRWTLEPADNPFWLLDRGRLARGTLLAW